MDLMEHMGKRQIQNRFHPLNKRGDDLKGDSEERRQFAIREVPSSVLDVI